MCNSIKSCICEKEMCGFDSSNVLDLGKDIDTLIDTFNNDKEIITCNYCCEEDILTDDNFVRICILCEEYYCIKCFFDMEPTREHNYWYDNISERKGSSLENVDIETFLCYGCSCRCEGCEECVCEESIWELYDFQEEDYLYRCNDCINQNHLDYQYNGEIFLKRKIEWDEEDCCDCIDCDCGDCDCSSVDIDSGEYNETDYIFCNETGNILCRECNENMNDPIRECYSCEKNYDIREEEIKLYLYSNDNCLCSNCVEENIHYL